MYSTEHGPSGFDGPQGGDEINLIQAGGNYGWPLVSHDEAARGDFRAGHPVHPGRSTRVAFFLQLRTCCQCSPEACSSALCAVKVWSGSCYRILIPAEVISVEKIISDIGRVRDVVQGPDGLLYFSTSNRDGRGRAREGDDHIYRIVPVY